MSNYSQRVNGLQDTEPDRYDGPAIYEAGSSRESNLNKNVANLQMQQPQFKVFSQST